MKEHIEIKSIIEKIISNNNLEKIVKPSMVNGKLDKKATIIEGENVNVIVATDGRIEIKKSDNKNPVICINPEGIIYRYNGEYIYVEDELKRLSEV